MTATVIVGDCVAAMDAMEPESVDAIICDPPYGLEFMGQKWDTFGRNSPPSFKHSMQPGNAIGGFGPLPRPGGLTLDGKLAFQAWNEVWARAAYRVLKPGGHLAAFSGTRTVHRMVCAIEDAGFEIRDQLSWNYGSGFPKSANISKMIDKQAGAARDEVPATGGLHSNRNLNDDNWSKIGADHPTMSSDVPVTDLARKYAGFGSAAKPSYEPICLARKPLGRGLTLAANVCLHGTGGLNIDAARVGAGDDRVSGGRSGAISEPLAYGIRNGGNERPEGGRWPPNTLLGCACGGDGHEDGCAVGILDRQAGKLGSGWRPNRIVGSPVSPGHVYGGNIGSQMGVTFNDEGGPSRFFPVIRPSADDWEPDLDGARMFYCAKSSRRERNEGLEGMPEQDVAQRYGLTAGGSTPQQTPHRHDPQSNSHPTVKPTNLMRWLVRLLCPPNGLILDCFAGSGSTGVAAIREGFSFIGIEQSPEYASIASARLAHAEANPEGAVPAKATRTPAPVARQDAPGSTARHEPVSLPLFAKEAAS